MEITRYDVPFDYKEIVDLWAEVFGIDEARLEEVQVDGSEVEYNRDFVYVAKDSGVILGVIHGTIPIDYPTFCGLSGMCTTNEARGKGVGRELFAKISNDLEQMGVETAFLGTSNMIAAKLYANNGFAFYPGTYIMYRQRCGGIVDLQKEYLTETFGKYKIVDGNQSFRIPVIPLVLNSQSGMICDVNTQISINVFIQKSCMGLYPRYLKLKEKGGHYFGALNERGLLGAMASVMPTDKGFRCDFFWSGNFGDAVLQLIEKCRDVVGEVYFQLADCDTEKIKMVETLGYTSTENADIEHNKCWISAKIYHK